MKKDELDQILLSDETLTPSSDFRSAVMSRLLNEATIPPPIPFPWIPFGSAAAMLAVVAALVARTQTVHRAHHLLWDLMTAWVTLLSDPAVQAAVLLPVGSIAGSCLLVWGSIRLTGSGE